MHPTISKMEAVALVNNGGSMADKTESKELMLADISFRDHLAAKAMNGILTNTAIIDELPDSHIEWVATIAYEMADAMLKARG